jgi:hypothetical protein
MQPPLPYGLPYYFIALFVPNNPNFHYDSREEIVCLEVLMASSKAGCKCSSLKA